MLQRRRLHECSYKASLLHFLRSLLHQPPQRKPLTVLTSSRAIVPQLDQGSSTRGLTSPSLTIGTTPGTTPGLSSGAREDTGVEDITARALVLIAEQLAVDVGQLTNEIELADLGLDSLMSLVLS